VWLLIVGGLLFAGCTAALIGAVSSVSTSTTAAPVAAPDTTVEDTTATTKAPATTRAPASTARQTGLNRAVRDGKFEFTVTKVDCTKRTVGSNEFTRTEASGVFCIVTAKVENIGNQAQYFDSSSQYLFDQQDRRHSVDQDAWAALDTNAFLEEINPGNKVTGTLVFDVPKGTKPTRLELHDSPFSGGVEVQL
jgi:hypothetical protein